MKKNLLIVILLAFCSLSAFVEIYDIQYTENPGENGDYPSAYAGQIVETGGIVTGVDFSGGRYFISSPSGGAWNGLYIYDNENSPQVGDELLLIGEVYEYYGFTELTSLSSYQVLSSGNALPPATTVQCHDAGSEAFESVLVRLENLQVTAGFDQYSQWQISDNSGSLLVGSGFFDLQAAGWLAVPGFDPGSLSGIISYSWGEFYLQPRTAADFDAESENTLLHFESETIYGQNDFQLPLLISNLSAQSAQELSLQLSYDETKISFLDWQAGEVLQQAENLQIQQNPGLLEIVYQGDFSYQFTQTLLQLQFSIIASGASGLQIDFASLDGSEAGNIFSGEIFLDNQALAIGDTLTTIQRPILNVPEIITPYEEFEIWCVAAEATENWQASLHYGDYQLDLQLNDSSYDADFQRWVLQAAAPIPEFYELFDLQVEASGGIDDITRNAVELIPQERADFSFVHISDAHLPTHTYWSDNPEIALTDTTEIENLRQVINDINLINPEFVLFTGDIVNEGELEDFGNGRVYTKAQKILQEFEVPVFLVGGNHDLGGWNATPPPQGTARRDWWRFFGWEWLADADASQLPRTQDYSFSYGNNIFIGLEAYLNYDSYMYEVFGSESFIPSQMNWLNLELANSQDYANRILFYHYDFSEQINLQQLGAQMALYGHIHSSEGSINQPPYNLAVDNVCDEEQAYRVIKVEDDLLQPQTTLYANWGNSLQVDYYPHNQGTAQQVTVTVNNQHSVGFTKARLKLKMPLESVSFSLENATIEQIVQQAEYQVVYALFDISAYSEKEIMISGSTAIEANEVENYQLRAFPNPVNISQNELQISFSLPLQSSANKLQIYNAKGQLVRSFDSLPLANSRKTLSWDGRDAAGRQVGSGVYIYQLLSGQKAVAQNKFLLYK
ncbi:MAG: metallophosphoesterase [Candidatus Cloacimonadales bacterium]